MRRGWRLKRLEFRRPQWKGCSWRPPHPPVPWPWQSRWRGRQSQWQCLLLWAHGFGSVKSYAQICDYGLCGVNRCDPNFLRSRRCGMTGLHFAFSVAGSKMQTFAKAFRPRLAFYAAAQSVICFPACASLSGCSTPGACSVSCSEYHIKADFSSLFWCTSF